MACQSALLACPMGKSGKLCDRSLPSKLGPANRDFFGQITHLLAFFNVSVWTIIVEAFGEQLLQQPAEYVWAYFGISILALKFFHTFEEVHFCNFVLPAAWQFFWGSFEIILDPATEWTLFPQRLRLTGCHTERMIREPFTKGKTRQRQKGGKNKRRRMERSESAKKDGKYWTKGGDRKEPAGKGWKVLNTFYAACFWCCS